MLSEKMFYGGWTSPYDVEELFRRLSNEQRSVVEQYAASANIGFEEALTRYAVVRLLQALEHRL